MKHMFGCDKIKSGKKSFMTKADLLFLMGILAAAFVLLFAFRVFRTPGALAVVSCDGQEMIQIALSQEEAQYYLVIWESEPLAEPKTSEKNVERFRLLNLSPEKWEEEAEALFAENGTEEYNLFVCENGEVRMIQSNCPDLLCVHHRAVSGVGENIICLPHKLVIEVIGAQENELDGVVY